MQNKITTVKNENTSLLNHDQIFERHILLRNKHRKNKYFELFVWELSYNIYSLFFQKFESLFACDRHYKENIKFCSLFFIC